MPLCCSSAKEKKLFLYAQHENGTGPKGKANAPAARHTDSKTLDGQVVRVWSGDQISIVDKSGKERRVQLSSTRAPKSVFFSVHLIQENC